MTSVNEYLYDGESVCIGRKGTIDKPRFIDGKFWTVDTLFFTHSWNNSNPKFVYSLFQKINWKKYNEASGVPSLSKATIEKIKVDIPPSLDEQQKIATFLSTIDQKIEQLTKKKTLLESYKKGVMQKIFSQQIRFKRDDGGEFEDWEEKRLEILAKSIRSGKTKPNEKGNFNVYGSTGIIGKNEEYTHHGEYILVARVGANAGLTNLVDDKFSVTDNTLIISTRHELVVTKFIFIFLQQYNLNRLVFGSGQPLITGKQLKSLKIKLPPKMEQQKIANFLTSLDQKITQTTQQIEAMKRFKKGLLQGMFV